MSSGVGCAAAQGAGEGAGAGAYICAVCVGVLLEVWSVWRCGRAGGVWGWVGVWVGFWRCGWVGGWGYFGYWCRCIGEGFTPEDTGVAHDVGDCVFGGSEGSFGVGDGWP